MSSQTVSRPKISSSRPNREGRCVVVSYKITVSKDLEMVTARYHLEVPAGGLELIASFSLYVDGEDIIKETASGNTVFSGTAFHKLKDETKDVPVNFAISSNTGWTVDGSDILRGGHPFDDSGFSNL
jgi:hypothetical protein